MSKQLLGISALGLAFLALILGLSGVVYPAFEQLDLIYLRLDTANDPLVGDLDLLANSLITTSLRLKEIGGALVLRNRLDTAYEDFILYRLYMSGGFECIDSSGFIRTDNAIPSNILLSAWDGVRVTVAQITSGVTATFDIFQAGNITGVANAELDYSATNCTILGTVQIGTYTGNGGATQAITGVGGQPIVTQIFTQANSAGGMGIKTTQDGLFTKYIDSNIPLPGPFLRYAVDHIISLDADGFTVGDGTGSTANVFNVNLQVYTYICWL